MSMRRCASQWSLPTKIARHVPLRVHVAFLSMFARQNSAAPRLSASLVIINAENEVLLVHRNPRSRSFGGFHVFPGGNFDAKQDDSLAMTAIRETFEESGLLIASLGASPLDACTLTAARQAIHGQKMLLKTFLAENRLEAGVSSLGPFTEWITPATAPRRFHTRFFVTFLHAAPSGLPSTPTPDGGQEVISARFVRPGDALAEFRERKIALMPAQFYILTTLSEILHGPKNTPQQREQMDSLSRGAFGRMVFNPVFTRGLHGRATVTYEGDETRGGSKGRLHRAVGTIDDAGMLVELQLLRNFNIFTEVESHVFESSRL